MNWNVSLTDDLDEFVKSRIATGRFASASEVVREALRLMEHLEQSEAGDVAWLRDAYQAGIASPDVGDVDFSAVKAEARASLERAGK